MEGCNTGWNTTQAYRLENSEPKVDPRLEAAPPRPLPMAPVMSLKPPPRPLPMASVMSLRPPPMAPVMSLRPPPMAPVTI